MTSVNHPPDQIGTPPLGHETGVAANLRLSGGLSVVLRGLLLAGKFLFMIALAKWTTPSTVGIYALILAVVTALIYLIGAELHSYTTREVVACETREEQARHLQGHFCVLLVFYLLSLPIAWATLDWIDISGRFEFGLFALVLLGEALCQELGRYLIVLSRPVASNFLQLLRGAAWMPAAILIFGRASEADAINIVLTNWALGCAAAAAFGLWHVRHLLWRLQPVTMEWFLQAIGSARHYFVVALLAQTQSYADRFIVQYHWGEAQVGLLAFYQSFANTLLGFVQTGVIAILLPRLLQAVEQRNESSATSIQRRMTQAAIGVALAGSLALAIGVPFVLKGLGKPEYQALLPLFYWLLVGNIFMVAALVPHFRLYAQRQDALLMHIAVIIVPLGVLANLVAVPWFGLDGAVAVFVISAAVQLTVKLYFARRPSRVKA